MKKIFVDEQLWYIENFLTQEEIDEIMAEANKSTGWYKTRRSISIRNKWLGVDIPLQPEGTICPHYKIDISGDAIFPEPGIMFPPSKEQLSIFNGPNNLWDRLQSVLPPTLVGANAMQSFWPLEGEELLNGGGGAYDWHYEKNKPNTNDAGMTAAWSLYINDDYDGGILEFKNRDISITPKPGMLVSIPMGEDWTHRVTPVINGIRHTLYGICHQDVNDREISTSENC